MSVKNGDTVKVLAHRNAYGEDTSTWRPHPFNVGETFVVGKVDVDDHDYPCDIVFPVGHESEFWRADDLEVVERANVPTFADRLRAYRAQGIGLIEARKIVMREDMLGEIGSARTVDDLKAILVKMVQS